MKRRVISTIILLGLSYASLDDNSIEQGSDPSNFLYFEALIVTDDNYSMGTFLMTLKNKTDSEEPLTMDDLRVFYSEANIDENGKRTEENLLILDNFSGLHIIKNGREAASSGDYNKTVYLSASNGLFTYKIEDKTVARHGSINDSIIGIAQVPNSELYILTEDHDVYEVTEKGEKIKIDDIQNAQQIVLDYDNSLYYYTPDKKVHIYTFEGVKDVEGLPENSSKIILFKPSIHLYKGITILSDNIPYTIYPNGTAVISGKIVKPTHQSIVYNPMKNSIVPCYLKDPTNEREKRLCFCNELLKVLG